MKALEIIKEDDSAHYKDKLLLLKRGDDMNCIRKEFLPEYYGRVGDFLKNTYSQCSSNWTIERWAWSRYFNGYWLEIFNEWPSTVGMWVDENDEIVAIVTNEGDKNGDVFFLLRAVDYSEETIHDLMAFAEEHFSVTCDERKQLYPRVNNTSKKIFTKVLNERGYVNTGRRESDAIKTIDEPLHAGLPEGFHFKNATDFTADLRALAHGRAFSEELSEIEALMSERRRAYTGLIKSPDYDESLDLCVVDESGMIAAFATFWFDATNRVGALEPLGTIPIYRKQGLGQALVYEGINRLAALGARKLHVASSQLFYKGIGFNIELETEIWEMS